MKPSKLMRKKSESAKGFTLIELMIVVAIIGILASVAIPNFLKARDKARFITCIESASGMKVAQEMYISDAGTYADAMDRLAMYMIPGCTSDADPSVDCPGEVLARMQVSCHDIALISMAGGYDYEISATAKDRYQCKICMNPKGYDPEQYKNCTLGACAYP